MRQRIQIGLTDRQTDRLASQTETHEAGHGQQRISSCCSSRPDVFFSHISVRFLWHNVDSPVEPTVPNPNPSPTPSHPHSAVSYMEWIFLLLLIFLWFQCEFFLCAFPSGFVELKNWCENSKGVASVCASVCLCVCLCVCVRVLRNYFVCKIMRIAYAC